MLGAASETTASAFPPRNSRSSAGKAGSVTSRCQKRKFSPGSVAIGRRSTAAIFPLPPTMPRRIWLQPPGAAPASITRSPGRTAFSFAAICVSLYAARERYPSFFACR